MGPIHLHLSVLCLAKLQERNGALENIFFRFLSTAKLKCCLDPNKKIPITKQFNKIALHHFCIQRQRQERWNIVEREFLGQQKGKVINFQFFFSFSWHLATLPTIRVSASLLLIEIDLNYRKMCSQICFHTILV